MGDDSSQISSTFKNVFIDVEDILKRSKHAKKNEKYFRPEMLYTAFSRASDTVDLIK